MSASQSYGFSSSHVWIWELGHKEGWALKSWYFQIVVLEKTLKVPWTARRSNQSILKEINHGYSEVQLLKLKHQYFGHIMWRASSLEKDPEPGKDWRQKEKGAAEYEMVCNIIDSMDMNLGKLWRIVRIEEPDVLESIGSQRVKYYLVTEQQQFVIKVNWWSKDASLKVRGKQNLFLKCLESFRLI